MEAVASRIITEDLDNNDRFKEEEMLEEYELKIKKLNTFHHYLHKDQLALKIITNYVLIYYCVLIWMRIVISTAARLKKNNKNFKK